MKKKSKKIVPLVMLVAVLAVLMTVACTINEKPGPDPAADGTEALTEPVSTGEAAALPVYCVAFYDPDGRILGASEVQSGEAAVPPGNPAMPQGKVFSHWDKDFSCVTEDLSVYAVCQQTDGQENVLALSGGYARVGEEIVIPMQLCGDVHLCAFDLRVQYDREKLEFVEFRSMDGAVDANCVEQTGEICLNYASMENTVGEVYLAELVFRAVGETGQTSVDIDVLELIAYDPDYNFQEPSYSTVSAAVTIAAP